MSPDGIAATIIEKCFHKMTRNVNFQYKVSLSREKVFTLLDVDQSVFQVFRFSIVLFYRFQCPIYKFIKKKSTICWIILLRVKLISQFESIHRKVCKNHSTMEQSAKVNFIFVNYYLFCYCIDVTVFSVWFESCIISVKRFQQLCVRNSCYAIACVSIKTLWM